MNFEYKTFDKLDPTILVQLQEIEKKVFSKPMSSEKIERELSSKNNVSILIAYDGEKPVGYKVGFERSKRIYYSWIGGVDPDYRKQGIAQELMKIQHKLAKDFGHGVVCTQTDNSFKPMIVLNLKSGFEIKGTIQSTGDDYITIVMEKDLTKS